MAVYTDVSDAAIIAFLEDYDLGAFVSLTGIAEGIENSNFALVTETGRYVLTLYERRVTAEDLPYFLGLTGHYARNGLPCAKPQVARDGQALRVLCDRPAAVFSWLGGVWPRTPTVRHCAAVGTMLARMHMIGQTFDLDRANALSVDGWTGLLTASETVAAQFSPALYDDAVSMVAALVSAWPEGLPVGHIHADLFPDNVFFQDDAVSGVIDFYFACRDSLAYDVAITLNAWCFGPDGMIDPQRARAFIGGYETIRFLTNAERAALPVLAQGAAFRFFVTRLYDWAHTPDDALVVRKDPMEYWHKARYHGAIASVSDYGLEP